MHSELFLTLFGLAIVKAQINQVSALNYINYTIPYIDYVCLNYKITANISEKCGEQLEIVCGNTTILSKMLDATSKFPYTGLATSTKFDYGDFDQCLTVDHKYAGGKILGKHCTAGLLVPDIFGDIKSFYQLSICKPDACSAEDYTAIANDLMKDLSLIFQDAMCQTVETGKEITASDIVTIIIFAVVILLMIISTIYDIHLYMTESDCPHPLYLTFSVLSNGRKLFQVSKNSKEQIQTFNGIRAISMMWIVAGHAFGMWHASSIINIGDREEWMNKTYAGYISTAPLSVDTFFFISGFLVAFQYLKQKAKTLKDHLISVPQMYIHRYLRLTPAMLMIFLVTISIIKHFGSGPSWTYGIEMASKECRKNWWIYFFYVQNIFAYKITMCLPQTWYLGADMQMFILSPLVLIPLAVCTRKSSGFVINMVGMLFINLIFIALPVTLELLVRDYNNHEGNVYGRLIDYFVGMMLAVFMRMKLDKPFLYMVKNSHRTIVNLLIWTVVLFGMLVILIYYREVEMTNSSNMLTSSLAISVYRSSIRPAWCIGLSWIVYSCYHGHGGIVNWILSGPLMQVLGRLTYCIYLLHIMVLILEQQTLRTKLYFSDYNAFYSWCGHFTVSTIMAIFWALAFESPLIIIEKHLLGIGHVQRKKPQTVEDVETNGKHVQ